MAIVDGSRPGHVVVRAEVGGWSAARAAVQAGGALVRPWGCRKSGEHRPCSPAGAATGTAGRRRGGATGAIDRHLPAVAVPPLAGLPPSLRRSTASAAAEGPGSAEQVLPAVDQAGASTAGRRRASARWVTCGLAAVAAVISACQTSPDMAPARRGSSGPPTPAVERLSPRATLAPPTAVDRAAVEAVYRRYWQVSRTMDRDYPPRLWRRVLSEVAVDPARGIVLARAAEQTRNKVILYGTVAPRPVVILQGRARARVSDCQDASGAGQADARTGRRRTVGVARNPVTAVVVRGQDGRWRVASVSYLGGSC